MHSDSFEHQLQQPNVSTIQAAVQGAVRPNTAASLRVCLATCPTGLVGSLAGWALAGVLGGMILSPGGMFTMLTVLVK